VGGRELFYKLHFYFLADTLVTQKLKLFCKNITKKIIKKLPSFVRALANNY